MIGKYRSGLGVVDSDGACASTLACDGNTPISKANTPRSINPNKTIPA
jgi:hypothetical protein